MDVPLVVPEAGGGPEVRVGLGRVVEVIPPDSGAPVRVNGRDYRGRVVLIPAPDGGTLAVNHLPLEEYLVGVVGSEMGRRPDGDLEALKAQAVASRTFALRAMARSETRAYDLLASVSDQVYAGIEFEYPLAARAVAETRGEVVSYAGQVADLFFHSTCGGRTAAGAEVFSGADLPYLRPVWDSSDDGEAWCAISPRFRWREEWSGEVLVGILRRSLPRAGVRAEAAAGLTDIQVLERSSTGRATRVGFSGPGGEYTVTGEVARRVLLRPDGALLRSAHLTFQVTRSGRSIARLVAEGQGAGHGVGMCQWGAIGRARGGHAYPTILGAYFPGTAITRGY